MIPENEEFFELLTYSKKLKENNKFLFQENDDKYIKLLEFSARIENNLQLREKNKYTELIEIFLEHHDLYLEVKQPRRRSKSRKCGARGIHNSNFFTKI